MKILANLSKAIVRTSEKLAIKSANTACHAWQYEPQMPAALKKHKK